MATRTATAAFLQRYGPAYEAVLAKWPADTRSCTVPTPYGATRVNSCGPLDAPPLLLLSGGGATSTVWFANTAEWSRTHRVHAVDLIGDPGLSTAGGPPVGRLTDLMTWLDAVLDGLRLDSTALCGHSYGGWAALHYALHAPTRTEKLVLIDPTLCFTGFGARYLLHALPMLLRPTPRNTRAFLAWETAGVPLDPDWLRLQDLGVDFPRARPLGGPRPEPAALRRLRTPTLLLLAERSRAHDIRKAATAAAEMLTDVHTVTLAGATHHTLPQASPAELNRLVGEFIARPR